jgi:hypothetical protein
MTEQELTDKLTRAYDKVMSKQMTEKERIQGEIKILQSKLELMEKLKDYKSPCEEAYKEWMGKYPPTDESVDNTDDIRWRAFQMGWMKAQQTYKVGEYQPTPQSPEEVEEGLKQAFREAKKSKEWQDTQKKIDKPKQETLYGIIREWNDDEDYPTCEELVDRIEEWLPKEQSAAGSQNAYVECSVEGFNDALQKIKRNLR